MVQVKRPVFVSGENPCMTLYEPGSDQALAVASYWHCTDSAFGVGHALILWLAAQAGVGRILTDNHELAQALATRLTRHFPEFAGLALDTLPYETAQCRHSYNGTTYEATCQSTSHTVVLAWRSPLDRKQIIWPGFPAGEATYDLTTVICPCAQASIAINGHVLAGAARVSTTAEGVPASSAFLAFAESWVGPLDGS